MVFNSLADGQVKDYSSDHQKDEKDKDDFVGCLDMLVQIGWSLVVQVAAPVLQVFLKDLPVLAHASKHFDYSTALFSSVVGLLAAAIV